MKKIRMISFLLVIMLLCGLLAGCGGSSEIPVAGQYKATYDMKDYLNEGLGGTITVDKVDIDFILDLKDDGTYKLYMDEEQSKDSITKALTYALGGQMTEEEVRKMLDSQGAFSEIASVSEEGKYTQKGDKLTLESSSGTKQDAEIQENGVISMKTEIDANTPVELIFKKQ